MPPRVEIGRDEIVDVVRPFQMQEMPDARHHATVQTAREKPRHIKTDGMLDAAVLLAVKVEAGDMDRLDADTALQIGMPVRLRSRAERASVVGQRRLSGRGTQTGA